MNTKLTKAGTPGLKVKEQTIIIQNANTKTMFETLKQFDHLQSRVIIKRLEKQMEVIEKIESLEISLDILKSHIQIMCLAYPELRHEKVEEAKELESQIEQLYKKYNSLN